MELTQLSVFLENRAGRLSEVADILGRVGVNIRALSLADTSDFGILRMIVDNTEKAVEALREQRFAATLTEVVAAEVDDQPGGLARVLNVLHASGMNVEYMYAFVAKFTDKACLVFRFDTPKEAIGVLMENGIRVLQAREVQSM